MFYSCEKLEQLNLGNFDTSKLINMDYIFSKCTSLDTLDISNFETENVQSMRFMFNYCTGLTELNLEKFNTLKCDNFDSVFSGIRNIKLKINKDKNENLLKKINGNYEIIGK
jgi:surface protein